jgi:hypothetical protein
MHEKSPSSDFHIDIFFRALPVPRKTLTILSFYFILARREKGENVEDKIFKLVINIKYLYIPMA